MTTDAAQTHEFKAEVSALLRLVTNSLYTHQDVFLRELISNASDALDKARFQGLVDPKIRDQDQEPRITIVIDKARGVLVVEDNGIGMTRAEVEENLGTIAHSGTRKFLEHVQANPQGDGKGDLSLIGQFGVGFYSAFMVADEIVVDTLSAHANNDAARWKSRGEGEFSVGSSDRTVRGTRIELHLKDEAAEFLESRKIEEVVKRYSNYVMHPILLDVVGEDPGDKPSGSSEPRRINQASAFWARSPRDLKDEDYAEFYKHVMGGFVLPGDAPLGRLHVSLDAPIQFHALLFIPSRAPFDLFMEDRKSLQLYARRVLVMESCDKLLPEYLRFFRGVVDSEDMPLNISRESLQEHKTLAAIRRQLTRKALSLLSDIARDDQEQYGKIWGEYGSVIKEGIHTDNGHRDTLVELLRYSATGGPSEANDKPISLEQYVEAMPEGQDAIYYITGSVEDDLAKSPHLEACAAKGYRVLLMTDAVDEWVVQELDEYRGKPLRNVTQGQLDMRPESTTEEPSPSSDISAAVSKGKEVLGERVKDVRASSRLRDSAACLVDDEGGLTRNMERILRAANRPVPSRPRILELNPEHPFVKALDVLAREKATDPRLTTWIELLLDQAHLAEGRVPDPAATVRRIQTVLDAAAKAGD